MSFIHRGSDFSITLPIVEGLGRSEDVVQVRYLKIERFRGIQFLELRPRDRNVLIGPNNSGKSTILEALDLALHSGIGRPRPGPSEIDYFGRDPASGFRIEVALGALDEAFLASVPD